MDRKRIFKKISIIGIGILLLTSLLIELSGKTGTKKEKSLLLGFLEESIMKTYLPGIEVRGTRQPDTAGGELLADALLFPYPVLAYSVREDTAAGETITESDYARLLLLEGSDEDEKHIEEGGLEYGEDAMHLDEGMQNALLEENGLYRENEQAREDSEAGQEQEEPETEEAEPELEPEGFVPATDKAYQYQWEELQTYDDVIKAFYAVDSTTVAGEELIDIQKLLEKNMQIEKGGEAPQILIYHTHSQEAFVDSIPGDESTTIVGAGEYLAQILREQYGYQVMHHTASFDKEARDYAYSNALPEMEQLLQENPSIQVVIDLHRDEMAEGRKLVMDLQGRPTAQFMFFNGMSRTKKGKIDYLENPYLADNLAFSFQMQVTCNEYYPGIARRIYLKAYRYNMHLCPKTLLIELGAQTNTVEEIWNACEPLAHVLDLVLSGQQQFSKR